MVAGRSSEPRTQTIGTTNASAAITGAAGTFLKSDAGRPISGTGIPAAATILSVASGTAATLSANATATGSPTATIGSTGTAQQASQALGFTGWSPESESESEAYTVAANNAGTPVAGDRVTTNNTSAVKRLNRG